MPHGFWHKLSWVRPRSGQNGIVGIKTGHTDEAGGCYLYAADQVIDGQKITIVGTILGAPDLASAISSSDLILVAAGQGFEKTVVVHAGQNVGTYKTPRGISSPIVASQDLSLLTWKGTDVRLQANFSPVKIPAQKGQKVGTISVAASGKTQEVPVILEQSLPGPSWYWRLFRL